MDENDVILDQRDINTIGDTIVYLSDSINRVASNMNSINGQVDNVQEQIDNMKSNVSSLEEEVRSFISEVKQSTLVGNAKQSIVISQMEYDRKFGHRDEVRRRVVGLLQAVDINAIKKNTMENIGEEIIINNPDYWLAPALLALCYWFSDNKEMASTALKKAIDRSDEKTSLFFCLVHLRANRIKTAIKWLNRYLSLQDPTKMDCKIIILLDALSNGVFDKKVSNILLKKIEEWKLQLNFYDEYKYLQINKWEKYFRGKDNVVDNTDNYVNDFVREKDFVNDVFHYSNFHINMSNEFKKIMGKDVNIEYSHYDKIDKLLNMLIFDYDDEELTLKTEIQKSKDIISLNGKIDSNYIDNIDSLAYYGKADLYTHISNICLNDNMYNVSLNTKKMAVSFSKEYIIQAYKNIINSQSDINLINLNITIDDWIGVTKDGSNELMLLDSLDKHIDSKYYNEVYKKSLFSFDMLISLILGVLGIVLAHKSLILVIFILLVVLVYDLFIFYKNYKFKNEKINKMNEEKKQKRTLLLNVICEIVDYYFIYFDSVLKHNEFIKYIESLDYNDYIKFSKQKNNRNIIVERK